LAALENKKHELFEFAGLFRMAQHADGKEWKDYMKSLGLNKAIKEKRQKAGPMTERKMQAIQSLLSGKR
jgi:hypothetical protein